MSQSTSDEAAAIEKVAEIEGEIREFVRRDTAALRRPPPSVGAPAADNIGPLLERVSGRSVQEIDRLIAELTALRATLHREGERVAREVIDYATLSQAAIASSRIIAETLTHLKKVPDAPGISA
jgi:hypothetical protein